MNIKPLKIHAKSKNRLLIFLSSIKTSAIRPPAINKIFGEP